MTVIAHVLMKHRNLNYSPLSEELLKVLANFSPRVESYKEQEFFIDLTGEKNIDKVIGEISGILSSTYCKAVIVSLAKTKLTSRASSLAITGLHPRQLPKELQQQKLNNNTIKVTVNGDERNLWSQLPVALLWPLPPKVIESMEFLGLTTCKQVQELPLRQLKTHFGSAGTLISQYCVGKDFDSVRSLTGINYPLRYYPLQGCADKAQLQSLIDKASHSLAAELAAQLAGFRELILSVSVEGPSRQNKIVLKTRTKKFNKILFTASALRTNATFLLDDMKLGQPVHSLIISLRDINPVPTKQMRLFDFDNKKDYKNINKIRREKLAAIIENLNRKYPAKLISFGTVFSISRREQMLQYWDPYRFSPIEVTSSG